jgi:hypothetical protein
VLVRSLIAALRDGDAAAWDVLLQNQWVAPKTSCNAARVPRPLCQSREGAIATPGAGAASTGQAEIGVVPARVTSVWLARGLLAVLQGPSSTAGAGGIGCGSAATPRTGPLARFPTFQFRDHGRRRSAAARATDMPVVRRLALRGIPRGTRSERASGQPSSPRRSRASYRRSSW